MQARSRARGKVSAKDTESECKVVTNGITASNLRLNLSSTQVEIVGDATKNFYAELQLLREVSHQRTVAGKDLSSIGFNTD